MVSQPSCFASSRPVRHPVLKTGGQFLGNYFKAVLWSQYAHLGAHRNIHEHTHIKIIIKRRKKCAFRKDSSADKEGGWVSRKDHSSLFFPCKGEAVGGVGGDEGRASGSGCSRSPDIN